MIDKLSFLKVGADGRGTSAEEERLMQLFQNRAGLKKAYADLQDEFHLLRDRLKQQEGATIRAEEQYDALADLLADPRSGFSALVFFQLRGLWKTCQQLLSSFAQELLQQQEARERAKHAERCEAQRAARLADIDARLRDAGEEADARRRVLAEAQGRLDRLTAFWHYFERRRRQRSMDALRSAVTQADAALGELHSARSLALAEPHEDFPGVSLGARRNINLVLIAYADLLCELVEAQGLAARAKEAVARRVHEMSFGNRAECEDHMMRVQKALAVVSNRGQAAAALKSRLERLRATCQYRNSADTVPTADSLGAALESPARRSARPAGAGPASHWNVLAEDYWDLYSVLLR